MSVLVWAQELHAAIKKTTSVIEKLAKEKDDEAVDTRTRLTTIESRLRGSLKDLWTGDDNLFEVP